MDSVLQSPVEAKSRNLGLLPRPDYESMLKEPIDRFLIEIQNGTLDFSAFRSIVFRLLQSSDDPPLEIVWLYSAVGYHETLSSKKGILDRVLAAKGLLHCLEASSALSSGPQSVALLAPVLFDLHSCVLEEDKVSGKVAKRVKKEIESLVEGIFGYISVYGSKSWNDEDSCVELLPCFLDLVRVWMVGRSSSGSGLALFFPLVSEEVRKRFGEEGCGVGYLAAVVLVEAFLMRLCLNVRAGGGSRSELHKELRDWAFNSVTAFQNPVFYEILLRLLLEPTLPVVSLLDSKDENLVRNVLYDAVILEEYSFLNAGLKVDRSRDFMKNLAIRRLIVSQDAIQIARAEGDLGKAMSYMNAFSASSIPSELIKSVKKQTGVEMINRQNVNTPHALLKWLVGLEEQGLRISNDSMPELRTKLTSDEPRAASEVSMFNPESNKTEGDIFFFDKQGKAAEDGEDMKSMNATFLAAAQAMNSTASNGRRKRKDAGGDEGETAPVKFVKYKIQDSSVKENFSSLADGISSGSEVDDPSSDEEMEAAA